MLQLIDVKTQNIEGEEFLISIVLPIFSIYILIKKTIELQYIEGLDVVQQRPLLDKSWIH